MSCTLQRTLVLLTAMATMGLAVPACDAGGGDEAGTGGGADCRQAANTCADGFTCTESDAGVFECTSANISSGGGTTGGGGSTGDGGGDLPAITGPSSECSYGYGDSTVAIDFGAACESAADCAHNTCIMPGDDGNITNNVFGFCSRGCDCDDSEDAKLPSENPDYHCVYPGGCFVGQSQGAWRHAVVRCSTVDDCAAVDARYTHCETTNGTTVVEDTCGSLKKVCQAHL
jgi:hypothetical protein